MEKLKKPKAPAVTGPGANANGDPEAPPQASPQAPPATHAHLIRISDQQARRRATTALGKVQVPYCGFTDFRLLVTDEHLDVLKREAIPFDVVS